MDANQQLIQALLEKQADIVTQGPVHIPFKAEKTDMIPAGKVVERITIHPLKVGTVFRIKSLLASIPSEEMAIITTNEERKFGPESPAIFEKYSDLILDIINISIFNKKGDPPSWFREMLKENCTWEDLHIILNAILFRMGSRPFCSSITALMKTVSPQEEKEIIALSRNLKSWTNR